MKRRPRRRRVAPAARAAPRLARKKWFEGVGHIFKSEEPLMTIRPSALLIGLFCLLTFAESAAYASDNVGELQLTFIYRWKKPGAQDYERQGRGKGYKELPAKNLRVIFMEDLGHPRDIKTNERGQIIRPNMPVGYWTLSVSPPPPNVDVRLESNVPDNR